ncbi:MAG: WD40 repeat domain-containing protein [Pirellulaceae bacterium]|nr:WD40 repeat domain-containing protein [Pirellulaceae bacterium]
MARPVLTKRFGLAFSAHLQQLAFIALALTSVSALADEASPLAKHDRWVTSMAFSADGSRLITGGGQSLQYRPGDITIWDTSNGALVTSLEGQKSNVWSVALSSDGNRLVTTGYNGEVLLWDVPAKTVIATLDKHQSWCRSVAMSPDGKNFVTAGEDGSVVVWETEGAKEVSTLQAHESAVFQVSFSPDGNTLATVSTDKTGKLWDWRAGTEKAKLEGHEDAVWTVSFARDGSRLATAGADRTVRIWDANGALQATLRSHRDWVTGVAFSADGKQLATSSHDRTVKVWDLEIAINLAGESDQTAAALKAGREARDKASEESLAAQVEADKAQAKTDAVTAVVDSRTLTEKSTQAQTALDGAPENEFLKKAAEEAKAALDKATAAADAAMKQYESDAEFTEKLKKAKEGTLDEAKAEIAALQVVTDEAVAKAQGLTEQMAAAEKAVAEATEKSKQLGEQVAKTLDGFKSAVWTVAFSPDGKRLASGSHKDSIRIWDFENNAELFPIPAESESAEATEESAE